uniref:hypothetical protein n=1 Tax=Trichocoleus desertorum TaxID=1481672 RepID=UPI0025B44E1C|nr:hypothetical protein [Trichocoleus desertorum]
MSSKTLNALCEFLSHPAIDQRSRGSIYKLIPVNFCNPRRIERAVSESELIWDHWDRWVTHMLQKSFSTVKG